MSHNKSYKPNRPKGKSKHITNTIGSTDELCPIWCFDSLDMDGAFAFTYDSTSFQSRIILSKIIEYSRMSWSVIKRMTHDNCKSKHHRLPVNELSAEAKKRVRALVSEEDEDAIFSFAFNNKLRIIGLREGRMFHVIWYDPEHKFCPSTM